MSPTPDAGTSQTGFLGSIVGWFAHPFNSQGSALNWVLWVGLIIVAIGIWNLILFDITKEMERQ